MLNAPHKTAVITGAAKGLGRALARECFRRGYALALLDTDGAGLAAVQQELSGGPQAVSIHTADISIEADTSAARRDIIQQHQRIDLLINNAGVSISQPFEDMALGDFRRLMEVNFWGTVYCTRHFLPHLRASGEGRIANIISGFALMGFPGKSAYCASKSAIAGFTRALQTELTGSGLRVSLVVPPAMYTDIVRAGVHMDEQKRAAEIDFLKRAGMPPDEVAARIMAGIERAECRIVVGFRTRLQDLAARLFPTFLHTLIGRRRDRFDFT